MTRRARAAVLAVATLVAVVAPATGASAEKLCTRLWVSTVEQRLCVPVP